MEGWEDMGNRVCWYPSSSTGLNCFTVALRCPEMSGSASLGCVHFSERGRKEYFEESGQRANLA